MDLSNPYSRFGIIVGIAKYWMKSIVFFLFLSMLVLTVVLIGEKHLKRDSSLREYKEQNQPY